MNKDKDQLQVAAEMASDLLSDKELLIVAVQLKEQIGALYKQREVVLNTLIERNVVQAVEWPEGSGEWWRLQDNFAHKNTFFHGTATNRFDVNPVKKEKPGK